MVLAGGQSLVPAMNFRLASPSRLVDIQHIRELAGISVDDGELVVGAMVRHRELELSEEAYRANPLIREALAHVAHVPIRNRGTVVGSLCHADAAAEMPMVLLLTGGSVIAEGSSGRRQIEAEDFFQLPHDHVAAAGRGDRRGAVPGAARRAPAMPSRSSRAATATMRSPPSVRSCRWIANGVAAQVLLAACGVSSRPVRLQAAEAILLGSRLVGTGRRKRRARRQRKW